MPKAAAYDKMETSKGNLKRYRCPTCGQTILFFDDRTKVQHLPMICKRCKQPVEVNIPPVPEP